MNCNQDLQTAFFPIFVLALKKCRMKFCESRFGKDTMQVDLAQLGVVDLLHETCMAQWDRFVACGQLEPFRNDKGTRQQSHALTCILLLRSSRVQ